MKWLTWSPPYCKSAGVRVLHRLTHLLNLAGESAGITTQLKNPEWNTPFSADLNSVIIYPEIAADNPYHSENYLIYGCNAPGVMGGPRKYLQNDILIGYHDRWNNDYSAALGREYSSRNTVTIGLIDPLLFNNPGTKRTGKNLCWIYKGAGLRTHYRFTGEENLEMISMEWPATRAELAAALQDAEYFYSYDRDTALLYEAYLCGCKVLVMGDDGTTREWYPDQWELNAMLAIDERDIDKALRIKSIYEVDRGMRKRGSEFFVAIYTNECKKYCDEKFFRRLKEMVSGYDCKITIVDNSATDDYFKRLCNMISAIGFEQKIDIEHIEVSREDRSTLFQRNVTESLELLQDEFLAGDWLYFVTLETDIFPKCDIFEAFLEVVNKADIIGGIYYSGFHTLADFMHDSAELVPVHHVLSGCTLYKRSVLKKHRFRWSMENIGAFPDAWMSFDAGKSFKLANYQKIKCDHMHTNRGTRGQELLQ